MREAAKAAGPGETLERYARDYPARPARPAAEHVPGLRLVARGLADAAHRERASAARPAASTASPSPRISTARSEPSAMCRSTRRRSSPASCSRTSAKRCSSSPIPTATTPSSSSISACPTASGVPLRLLPKEIDGVRIIGIDVPGFGVPTHAEAKDVLAGAMLNFARLEAEQGPVQAPRTPRAREADGHAARRNVSGRPGADRRHARPDGLGRRPGRADARMARTLWRARLRRGRGDSSVLYRVRPRVRARRAARSSAPRRSGYDGTAAWLEADRRGLRRPARHGRRGEGQAAAGDQGRARGEPRSKAASRSRATRVRSCSSRG